MNFYDKITGNDMNRQQKEFQLRVEQLPADYRSTWATINQTIWSYSDFSGRNLYPILDGILGLMEESAAEGLPIQEVVGSSVEEFLSDVALEQAAFSHREKLRNDLNKTIFKKLGR